MTAQYKFFVVPVKDITAAESDLNRFLRSARILTVHRDFVSQGDNSFWGVAVEYLSNGSQTAGSSDAASRKTRVDYKAVLPPEDFALFAQLREWRKAIAEKEGVPVYTIFTNDQLAAMVTKKITSLADLGGIDGVGDARLSKYGTEIVRLMQEAAGSLEEKTE